MAEITFLGKPLKTVGSLPGMGDSTPAFTLTKSDLSEIKLSDFKGKKVVLSIFPSLDTPTCATAMHKFNEESQKLNNVAILCISADLPFAQKRFCATENVTNVIPASVFRHPEFGHDYGVTIADGPLAGLLSRAIIVLDEAGKVIYTQQVQELSDEPDYNAVLTALQTRH